MARTKKTTEQVAENTNTTSKMSAYRTQLKSICNNLAELAKCSGRTDFTLNQLLRECYQLTEQEIDTFEGWKAKGANVRKGQHAYLFWGAPVESKNGYTYCPVAFMFSREQVRFATINA